MRGDGILGLVAEAAEACQGFKRAGLIEMLRRIKNLVSELYGSLGERGLCEKIPEVCENLGRSSEGVGQAAGAANTLLLEFADLLLGLQGSRAEEVVERLSRLQSLAGVVYTRVRGLVEVLVVLRDFLSAYGRLTSSLDVAAVQVLAASVLGGVRDAICGYVSSVAEGLVELRRYYEARGRLVVYRAFELVFGHLALLLLSVVGRLEEVSEYP